MRKLLVIVAASLLVALAPASALAARPGYTSEMTSCSIELADGQWTMTATVAWAGLPTTRSVSVYGTAYSEAWGEWVMGMAVATWPVRHGPDGSTATGTLTFGPGYWQFASGDGAGLQANFLDARGTFQESGLWMCGTLP